MPLQSLTPAGVAATESDLYALSDEDLQEQADQIRSNLKTWVSANFDLTTDQSTFLINADPGWLQYTGDIVSFAVSNRLSVGFTVSGDPSDLKLVHTTNDLVSASDGSYSGTVTIAAVYS